MNSIVKYVGRLLLSNMRGSQNMGMRNDIMRLFGIRRRRSGSFFTTILGAGALAYGIKKIMDQGHGLGNTRPQFQNHSNAEQKPQTSSTLSTERKSAIRNIINSYSKNDPGLKAALQEFSSEFGETEKKQNTDEKNSVNKKESHSSDWEL